MDTTRNGPEIKIAGSKNTRSKKMKLGLDIHGVIDKYPSIYVDLACNLRCLEGNNGVYIITGQSITQELIDQLRSYCNGDCFWDELISIQDRLISAKAPILGYDEDRPLFDEVIWNSFKGQYCKTHKIDLMIDDSIEYREYFTTPFLLA